MLYTLAVFLLSAASSAVALDHKCAPGDNFELSRWKLQEPVGEDNKPNEVRVPSSKTIMATMSFTLVGVYSNMQFNISSSAKQEMVSANM